MTLIGYIREYQTEGLDPKDAVDQAVQRCIAENILSGFLTKHRAKVMDVLSLVDNVYYVYLHINPNKSFSSRVY